MKILFITSYYPPNTEIAAIRPWGLCNNLAFLGHEITVISWGGDSRINDGNMYDLARNVNVIYMRNPFQKAPTEPPKKLVLIKDFLVKFYRKINYEIGNDLTFLPRYWIRGVLRFLKEKKIIDKMLKENIEFDVVISTFGDNENLLTGQYAAKKFKSKLIQDFRDIIPRGKEHGHCFVTNVLHKYIEAVAIEHSDAVLTVSKGMQKGMKLSPSVPTYVLYNGYINTSKGHQFYKKNNDRKLRFCYTGSFYKGLDDLSILFKILNKYIHKGMIKKGFISLDISGPNGDLIEQQAEKFALKDIIMNHGVLSQKETMNLHYSSDIYVVSRWNKVGAEGIISGKFYEGIRAHIPMIVLVNGNLPNSELFELNKKYNYGFCYEYSQADILLAKFEKYVFSQYERKYKLEKLTYNPNPKLFIDFEYKYLAKELEKICLYIAN